MTKEETKQTGMCSDMSSCKDWGKKNWNGNGATGGGIYFLAFVGTLVYYLQNADSFWTVILGILQAIVWPALLIYKVYTLLGM